MEAFPGERRWQKMSANYVQQRGEIKLHTFNTNSLIIDKTFELPWREVQDDPPNKLILGYITCIFFTFFFTLTEVLLYFITVDPVVPSCTEGLFLPKFLPPTPENRATFLSNVNQPLKISIAAEAANATWVKTKTSPPLKMWLDLKYFMQNPVAPFVQTLLPVISFSVYLVEV